jgi:aspartate 1-decarboxylase
MEISVTRTLLKSKIHRAVVTDADLNYEGSLSIDADLMKRVNILPYEKIDVVNITTGDRFTTYAIEGKSGEICLNGGAARLGQRGDLVIILAYADLEESELEGFEPKIILLDENNRPKSQKNG